MKKILSLFLTFIFLPLFLLFYSPSNFNQALAVCNAPNQCFDTQCGSGFTPVTGGSCAGSPNLVCCGSNSCRTSADCSAFGSDYTCTFPAGNPTFGGTCTANTPPSTPGVSCSYCPNIAGYYPGAIMNNDSGQVSSTLNVSCPNVDQVCYYSNVTSGSRGTCNALTTKTCNSNQSCDKVSGCYASGEPPPASCTVSGKACTTDTQCNGASDACSDYHCIDSSTGFIYTPETATTASKPMCQNKPDANLPPGKGVTCLICDSGCTTTDASGKTSCVKDCNSTTKVDPKSTQFCDAFTQTCTQGKGCVALNPTCNIKGGCDVNGIYKSQCGFDPTNPAAEISCDTALGNIKVSVGGFINSVFLKLLGFISGLAVLLIVISGYRLMVSQGNPEKLQQAREQLTAAIIGLLFIVFSLVILQVIGYDVLRLPGITP